MRDANALNIFNPPMNGDTLQFPDGTAWEVYQDGMQGWCLTAPGARWKGIDREFGHYPAMVDFLRAINDKVRNG